MTAALYTIAILALSFSLLKVRKTVLALKKAWKSFEYCPSFIYFDYNRLLLAVCSEQISKLPGRESGWYVLIAAAIGSIT